MAKKKNNKILDTLNRLTTGAIYGTDQDVHDSNKADITEIKGIINKINGKYKQNTGSEMMDFFNSVSNNENRKKKDEDSKKNKKKELIKLDDIVKTDEYQNAISDIFFSEKDRFNLYHNFDLIYNNIPQMGQALDTYVDNILSPDDFTKNIFNVKYNDIASEVTKDIVMSNLNRIKKNYNIKYNAKKYIKNALKNGDEFVAILKISKEIDRLLVEDEDEELFFDRSNDDGKKLGTEDIRLTNEELSVLESMNKQSKGDKVLNLQESMKGNDYKQLKENWQSYISEILNENIEVEYDSKSLTNKIKQVQKDFASDKSTTIGDNIGGDNNKSKDDKNNAIELNGSIVKRLEPENVIKLEVEGVNYGYYYIEKRDERFGESKSTNQAITDIDLSFSNGDLDDNTNKKVKLVNDIFAKNIASKIDKTFIKDNPEFKNIIHNLLRNNYITNGKVKIIYLQPDEVVHFKGDDDGSVYGESLYKNILFTAKMYLTVLTSDLMSKLVRSPDKRTFYIEVGLDEDSEAAVESFVRDIKTKDITMDNLKDIDTAMNSVGTFQDYYIPVVNGEKPVEIDRTDGLDTDIKNDFSEYLLEAMISGVGIPKDFLSYSDTEFVRSLAMQNGKFIRSIIVKQSMMAEGFNKLIRMIYKNEFDHKGKQGEDFDVRSILQNISVEFPPPSSLNVSNLSEQIRNSGDVINFIVETYMGDRTEDEELKRRFKKTVTKEFIPSIEWSRYDTIYENAIKGKTKDELLVDGGEDEDSGGGSSW